jgi:hypothetical protein
MASWKASMANALQAINDQYAQTSNYYDQASTDFETQFQQQYGQTMTDAVNNMASNDIFESPVSEKALNRTRQGLNMQYAVGKSALAGQKMSALSSIEGQKIGYYQNLASLQQSAANAKRSSIMQGIGAAASLGAMAIIA